MTTNERELTLFGGWASMQILQVTASGASRSLAVTSVSISPLKLRPELRPGLSSIPGQVRLIFGGSVQVQYLLVTGMEIAEKDQTISLDERETLMGWDRTYRTLWEKLWAKLERFHQARVAAIQQEPIQQKLWREDEELDQGEQIKVFVEVSPLGRPTDQIHMLWIARLELRQRILAFEQRRRRSSFRRPPYKP